MDIKAALLPAIREFAAETQERCEASALALLALERGSDDPGDSDTIARNLHALKGSAGTLGLARLSNLAHRAEDLLVALKRRGARLRGEPADALLGAFDAFLTGVRLAGEAGEESPAYSLDDVMARLAAAAARTEEPVDAPADVDVKEPWRAPADDGTANDFWRVSVAQIVSLMKNVLRVRELRLDVDQRRIEIERLAGQLSGGKKGREASDVRHTLAAIGRGLRSDVDEAADTIVSLEQGLRSIATLRVRTLLEPLHRAVRDLCRQTGKEAQLAVVGDELAVDRRVLESLRGPIVQLVRNCIAHGIEAPEVRMTRGKHREGAVVVRFEQVGNMLFLAVEDDGDGIDFGRIREAAVEHGLTSAEEAQSLDSDALTSFLFRPGFSTLPATTEIAGRGVGLDLVLAATNRLRGRVNVESVAGQGSRFVLTLPIDLGSSPVVLVRVIDQVFGLPVAAVESGVALRTEQLREGLEETRLSLGPHAIRLSDLAVLLGLRRRSEWQRGQPVILLRHKGNRVALAVDEVVSTLDLVVRPLPSELKATAAYLGAAAMALGELVLVLDPAWISAQRRPSEPAAAQGRRVLVVDDSIAARTMYRSALESGGWSVSLAATAEHALSLLRQSEYSAVVVDVMLGHPDGVWLASELHARQDTRGLPVILVSSSRVELSRGRGTGAAAFLEKRSCTARHLLEQLDSVVEKGVA